ncbi:GntR family transcriptional regulator [Nocardia salmonicida]|uniref:GntR family transcriptional regulator n=1 Tax=Nocardia salmonicida TaxID=53431 RepID=UPI0033DF2113
MSNPDSAPDLAHARIARAIKGDIDSGALRDGQLLPTTRELSAHWRASPRTVTEAMQVLIADGYVHARSRSHRIVTAPSTASVEPALVDRVDVNGADRKPAYERIADEYTRQIHEGSLSPSSPLPSQAEMAEHHGVSNIVIRDAIRLLKSRGLIRTVRRRGAFVAEQLPADDHTGVSEAPIGEIERIRAVADPIRRARLATELSTQYQIRLAELSSIRQTAIEDAYAAGVTATEIAQRLGLTKGRISQIRHPKV